MIRNHVLSRLPRLVALTAVIGIAAPAFATESVRVFVVKEKKNGIAAPAARDTGFVLRALAKRFGVKAPKGKTSVVQVDLPAAAWEANKIEIAGLVSHRGLSVIVSDEHPELGRAWAKGFDLKDRGAISLASEAEIEISMPGANIEKLAARVLLDEMADKVAGARHRNSRGGLMGAPAKDEESALPRPGKLDIDFGPEGAPIELDCEATPNDPACDLSPGDLDVDPDPNADDHEADVPFTRPDCDPFVDATCDGGDPCELGLEEGHPLSDALGCGFLDNVTDGAIGPRSGDYDVGEDDEVNFTDDRMCGDGADEGHFVCRGEATVVEESEDEVCSTTCEEVVCRWVTANLRTTRTCTATGCTTMQCL